MEISFSPEKFRKEAEICIARYGRTPEHNYTYFLTTAEGAQSIFLKSDDGYGGLANYREKVGEVVMISEALAPREKQVKFLHQALNKCFSQLHIKKFVVEQDEALREETIKSLKGTGYKATAPRYALYWPVFKMNEWTGASMAGEEWKKLRNIKNRFYSEHKVEVVDSRAVDSEKLKKIVLDWVERRKLLGLGADRKDSNLAYYQRYIDLIGMKFEGIKMAKTLVVDGEPCTITAGWEVPNSTKSYYSAVGISNYAFEGLGEMANLDDLHRLKEAGYETVDFGGSPMPLLKFKLKFRPHFVYVTHTYAIVKK